MLRNVTCDQMIWRIVHDERYILSDLIAYAAQHAALPSQVQEHADMLPLAGGGQDSMDIGAYVHLYGREFVHTDVRLALEYYLAAARVQGDTPAARGRLLRELLTESRAYGADSSAAVAAITLLSCMPAARCQGPQLALIEEHMLAGDAACMCGRVSAGQRRHRQRVGRAGGVCAGPRHAPRAHLRHR